MPPISSFYGRVPGSRWPNENDFYDFRQCLRKRGQKWQDGSERSPELSGGRDRIHSLIIKKDYAFEELIAEIAVSILGVKRGFKTDLEQSAAKVEGWINAL
ncbi:zincin-like metallopeptidase domain-containing protein [Loktanella sp. D2R18]|uniref:zincin-like metallopeptidase domain-containing protein n=1 Tax=Yoonia sp. 1_MG-2023 TaxID=3062659 RepID=UPI001C6884E4